MIIITAAVFSFFASARSLQIGDGVAVIAVTSVAANLSTILAGLAVFADPLGNGPLVIGVRLAAFALILIGAALNPSTRSRGRGSRSVSRGTSEPYGDPRLSRRLALRRQAVAEWPVLLRFRR